VQFTLAVVAPVVFGAVCGYVLGSSAPAYNALMLLAGLGGVGAGFEHRSAREGAVRGIVGGALFAAALAASFAAHGAAALVPLPLPLAGMAVVYGASGMPLGALGGSLRARAEHRRAAAEARG
jgi:hypothetical protein